MKVCLFGLLGFSIAFMLAMVYVKGNWINHAFTIYLIFLYAGTPILLSVVVRVLLNRLMQNVHALYMRAKVAKIYVIIIS